jgi:thiol reductant ABC exporter CydD subunit
VKPFDPRLLQYARATRFYLIATVGLGLLTAGLIIAQASLLATAISHGESGAALGTLTGTVVALAVVIGLRALVTYLQEVTAHRSAAQVMSQLRVRLVRGVLALGPEWLAGQRSGELTTLAGRGVEALDGYFSRYLPQLVLSALVPAAIVIRLAASDLTSAIVVAVTLPLLPLFLAVVGSATSRRTARHWGALAVLSAKVLDLVLGLPTLRIFGRAKSQAAALREASDEHRRATMGTLRLAFLSALVLELTAALSIALVAVMVGLRLLHGHVTLHTALLVLLLAPEAYLPLRAVGTQFHASMEGVTAADRVFSVIEAAPPADLSGTTPRPDLAIATLELSDVGVQRNGRSRPAPDGLCLTVRPGERVALVGPSGCGKSTVLSVLLRFCDPTTGSVSVGGVPLASFDVESWRRQVVWVPQRPHLFAGSVADNVRLGVQASDDQVRAALQQVDAHFVADLPMGIQTQLGERGEGLSTGQRQRVALARAFLRPPDVAPLLLLDEPTAGLDARTEAALLPALDRLCVGRTVLLVAHREALLPLVDRVVSVAGEATHDGPGSATPVVAGEQLS